MKKEDMIAIGNMRLQGKSAGAIDGNPIQLSQNGTAYLWTVFLQKRLDIIAVQSDE